MYGTYGILAVEDGNGLYQIIGEVVSHREAEEMARGYEKRADPENPNTFCPPSEFVVWQRGIGGAYTVRIGLTLKDETTMDRLGHIEKLCASIPLNSALLSAIQEVKDRLNGKE